LRIEKRGMRFYLSSFHGSATSRHSERQRRSAL
jgi:hypothetical protein